MTTGGCRARVSWRPFQAFFVWLHLFVSSITKALLAVLILALPAELHAQFTLVTNNGAITIWSYSGPGGYVVIPSFTNGRPVTVIGAYSFWKLPGLTGVSIPSSITNI